MKIMKLYWMKIDQVQVRNNKCLERNSTVLNQINHQLKLSLFNRIWKIKNDITIIYKQNHKLVTKLIMKDYKKTTNQKLKTIKNK
jgi:hypothetical protein